MTRQNELRDILHKAARDASKVDPDEAWGDVLEQLDEHMPEKKKKRRFFFIFFFFGVLALFSGIMVNRYLRAPEHGIAIQSGSEKIIRENALGSHLLERGSEKGNGHSVNSPPLSATDAPLISGKQTSTPGIKSKKTMGRTPEKELNRYRFPRKSGNSGKIDLSMPDDISTALNDGLSPVPSLNPPQSDNIDITGSHIDLIQQDKTGSDDEKTVEPGPENDSLIEKDSTKPKDKKDDEIKTRRKFSVGGSIGYAFNNFTAAEKRFNSGFTNGIYQVAKQADLNLYCRIPFGKLYQLQPELGIEPYSTNIQINYRTPGFNTFTRYNLNRLLYARFGVMNYLEISRDLYLLGGLYYGYALPSYGAKLEMVSKTPHQPEQVLSSSYERSDFRKTVFDLRRSDFGLCGGLEYCKKRISGSVRLSRGMRDVTPETPSAYYNFNISLRIGYHFEFK
jgi:hypothetical protein